MTNILYTTATDSSGNLVSALEAEKGNKFSCPICEGQMILRKSGNTGKGSKRPHFAHKGLTENCTPESVLHYSFKTLLAKELQDRVDREESLMFSWDCETCCRNHKGNLLKKANRIELELDLKSARPDIAILDSKGEVYAVIEIVVTHKPEKKVLKFYKKKNTILIQLNLSSDQDIYFMENRIASPDLVDLCLNSKRCSKCGSYMDKKVLQVVEGKCAFCKQQMKVALSMIDSAAEGSFFTDHREPNRFNLKEIEIARSKGVLLQLHYNSAIGYNFLANTCGSCRRHTTGRFLMDNYFYPAFHKELPSANFVTDHSCSNCSSD